MGRGWGIRKPPDLLGRFLLSLPGVLFSICHDPDQAYHKRSLLRKEEDDNQANNYLEQVHKIHFRFPFLQSTAKVVTKKPPGWAACVSLAGVVISSLSPVPSQP